MTKYEFTKKIIMLLPSDNSKSNSASLSMTSEGKVIPAACSRFHTDPGSLALRPRASSGALAEAIVLPLWSRESLQKGVLPSLLHHISHILCTLCIFIWRGLSALCLFFLLLPSPLLVLCGCVRCCFTSRELFFFLVFSLAVLSSFSASHTQ